MREKHKFWALAAKGDGVGELTLYGEISSYSWYGDEVTPKQFKEDLDALGDIDTLRVYINSGGGDVFAGWNILNMLRRHPARTIGYNDGLAASVAFDILMGLDEVVAMENSMFMTHNCWTFAIGNRHDLREQADMMEKIDKMLAQTTAERSGKTEAEIIALQDRESWFTAKEALAEGFADRVEKGAKLAARIDGGFFVSGNERVDLARYRNPPHITPGSHATAYVHTYSQDHAHADDTPGGGSDTRPEAPAHDALAAQRAYHNELRRKILGGW